MKYAIGKIEALVLLILGFAMTGCTSEATTEPVGVQTYDVAVSLSGEYDATMASRSIQSSRYYGIEVYAKGAGEEYSKYAYGLFSEAENLTISLMPGTQYRFECMMIEDGVDRLNLEGSYPFNSHEVSNRFVYGSDSGFNLSHSFVSPSMDSIEVSSGCYLEKPCLTMMYGALDDYAPSEKGRVLIPLYRIGYGLKVNVESVPEGVLRVMPEEQSILHIDEQTFGRNWDMSFSTEGSVQHVFADGLFTINDYPEDWQDRISTFSKSSRISFVWTHSDGWEEEFSKDVTFKRNVTNVLNVDLSRTAGIKFELEDTDMEEEVETIVFKAKEWEESLMGVDL